LNLNTKSEIDKLDQEITNVHRNAQQREAELGRKLQEAHEAIARDKEGQSALKRQVEELKSIVAQLRHDAKRQAGEYEILQLENA